MAFIDLSNSLKLNSSLPLDYYSTQPNGNAWPNTAAITNTTYPTTYRKAGKTILVVDPNDSTKVVEYWFQLINSTLTLVPKLFLGWGLSGNSGTSETNNFIGTSDNTDLVLRTNNIVRGKLTKDAHFIWGATAINNFSDFQVSGKSVFKIGNSNILELTTLFNDSVDIQSNYLRIAVSKQVDFGLEVGSYYSIISNNNEEFSVIRTILNATTVNGGVVNLHQLKFGKLFNGTGAGELNNLHIAPFYKQDGSQNPNSPYNGIKISEGDLFLDSSVNGTTIWRPVNIKLSSVTGTKIGTTATEKLAFWGATPIIKPTVTGTTINNNLLTTLATIGLITDSTTFESGGGSGGVAQWNETAQELSTTKQFKVETTINDGSFVGVNLIDNYIQGTLNDAGRMEISSTRTDIANKASIVLRPKAPSVILEATDVTVPGKGTLEVFGGGLNIKAKNTTNNTGGEITMRPTGIDLLGPLVRINASSFAITGSTSPGAGKILTSDQFGNATWQAPTTAIPNAEQVYTGTDSVIILNTTAALVYNNSSVSVGKTITMPPAPVVNQVVTIFAIGDINELTIAANTGQSFSQPSAVTGLLAGESVSYRYSSLSKWLRQ